MTHDQGPASELFSHRDVPIAMTSPETDNNAAHHLPVFSTADEHAGDR